MDISINIRKEVGERRKKRETFFFFFLNKNKTFLFKCVVVILYNCQGSTDDMVGSVITSMDSPISKFAMLCVELPNAFVSSSAMSPQIPGSFFVTSVSVREISLYSFSK